SGIIAHDGEPRRAVRRVERVRRVDHDLVREALRFGETNDALVRGTQRAEEYDVAELRGFLERSRRSLRPSRFRPADGLVVRRGAGAHLDPVTGRDEPRSQRMSDDTGSENSYAHGSFSLVEELGRRVWPAFANVVAFGRSARRGGAE